MSAIEIDATVTDEGVLVAKAPPELAPGRYRVLVMKDDVQAEPEVVTTAFGFQAWPWKGWPSGSTFRREYIYGDDGR